MSQKRLFENPAKDADDDTRVWANLDPSVHQYFFRKVLAGCTGSKQAIINIFFQKFHEACLAGGITPEWSLENEFAVRDILKNLNFNGQPTRTRRTNNSAPKRKSKPLSGHHESGGSHRVRKEAKEPSSIGADSIGKA
jgi:hypothetical protein